jgi:anti-sigma factor RsiW
VIGCSLKNGEAAELVVGYTARTLDPKTEAEFEQHLEACESCRELFVRQQAVWSALDTWRTPEVSQDFDQKLFQRIAEQEQASWWRRLARPGWSWAPALPVAAACAVLAAAFFLKDPSATHVSQSQARPRIEQQVERALDDMDMLSRIGVDAVEGPSSSQKI